MFVRFFRRIFLTRWVSLNISKSGPSVSVGPHGAKVTASAQGIRITGGLPGTGLSVTKRVSWTEPEAPPPALSRERLEWRHAFYQHLHSVLENHQATVGEMRAALAYRETLRLTDEELGEQGVQLLAKIQVELMEADAVGRTTFYPES